MAGKRSPFKPLGSRLLSFARDRMAMYGAGSGSVQRKPLAPSWADDAASPLNWSQEDAGYAEDGFDAVQEPSFDEAFPEIDRTTERVVKPSYGSTGSRRPAPASGQVQRDMAPAQPAAEPAKPAPMDRSQFLAFLWQQRESQLQAGREQIQRSMAEQSPSADQAPAPPRPTGKRRRGAVVDVPVARPAEESDSPDSADPFFLNESSGRPASPAPVQLSRDTAAPAQSAAAPQASAAPSPAAPGYAHIPDPADIAAVQLSRDDSPDAISADDPFAAELADADFNTFETSDAAPPVQAMRAGTPPSIQPDRADTPPTATPASTAPDGFTSTSSAPQAPAIQASRAPDAAPRFSPQTGSFDAGAAPQLPTEAFMSPASPSGYAPDASDMAEAASTRPTPTVQTSRGPSAASAQPHSNPSFSAAAAPQGQAPRQPAPAIQPSRDVPDSSMMYMPRETILRDSGTGGTVPPPAASSPAPYAPSYEAPDAPPAPGTAPFPASDASGSASSPGIQLARDESLATTQIPTEAFMTPRESGPVQPTAGAATPSVQKKSAPASPSQPRAPGMPSSASLAAPLDAGQPPQSGSIQRSPVDASSQQPPQAASSPYLSDQADYPAEAPTLLEQPAYDDAPTSPQFQAPSSSFNTFDAPAGSVGRPGVQRKVFSDSVPPDEDIPEWKPSAELAPPPPPSYADPSPWLGFVPDPSPSSTGAAQASPVSDAPKRVQRKKARGITEFSETVSEPKPNIETPRAAPGGNVQRAPEPGISDPYTPDTAPRMDLFEAMQAAGMISSPASEPAAFSPSAAAPQPTASPAAPSISRSTAAVPPAAPAQPAANAYEVQGIDGAPTAPAFTPAPGSVESDLLRLINLPADTPVAGLNRITSNVGPQATPAAPAQSVQLSRDVSPPSATPAPSSGAPAFEGPPSFTQTSPGGAVTHYYGPPEIQAARAKDEGSSYESPYTPVQPVEDEQPAKPPSKDQGRPPALPPTSIIPPPPPTVTGQDGQDGQQGEPGQPVQRAINIEEIETTVGTDEKTPEPDVEKLARTVFGMLRDKLRTENERRGR
jgi:hypothetical protein